MNDGHNSAQAVSDPTPKPIFLVGMMGAGKTTIGRSLARLLGWQFVDLDHEIEARCGVRISVIFDIEGEQGFRKREHAILDALSKTPHIVLATGGGAVLWEENRHILHTRGTVVYLQANVEELYRRVEKDKNRPLLQTEHPKQRLHELLTCREPLYAEVAHMTFETGKLPIYQTTRRLFDQLLKCGFITTVKPLKG